MGLLQLLAPDQSTVLWDFDDPTGAANPNTVATNLAAGLSMGTIGPDLDIFQSTVPGGILLSSRNAPVEMSIPFTASASSDDNLWAGLGQLARYLQQSAPDFALILKWTELTENRYVDVIGALSLPQLLRGQGTSGLVALRKSSLGPLTVTVLRQPWMRGPAVTTTGVTVPDDPATSAKARVYPVTISGDLPTPAKIAVKMDTGATVDRVLIANRPRRNRAASYFADYLSDTAFFQCEATGRGWTITLGTDTTATTDANASPGASNTIARVTHATDPTYSRRRVRATRTTKLDSMWGSWDAWVRVKAAAARDYRLEGKWGPSTADPPAFSLGEISHNTAVNGTPAAFGYVELNLGRFTIPNDVTLGALAFEVWTRQASGTAQNLDLDLVWFVPADNQGTVIVPETAPAVSKEASLGSGLTTPSYKLTADPTWTAGTPLDTLMNITDNNDAAGLGPNAGEVWGIGRHIVRFRIQRDRNGWTGTATVRIVTVGGGGAGAVISSTTFTSLKASPVTYELTVDDAAGTAAYQAQVTQTAWTNGFFSVIEIIRTKEPTLALNESARTDPGFRHVVDRLNSSGSVSGYLSVQGAIPAMLEPGDNHLMIRCDEQPLAGYAEHENKLARTPTVTVTYDPRYAL